MSAIGASLDDTHEGEPTGQQAHSTSFSREWLAALRYCAAVYLAVRLVLFLISTAAWGLTDGELTGRSNAAALVHTGYRNAITGWFKLDSGYFTWIARSGYQGHYPTAAFFPGYPILIRAASYLCLGNLIAAAFLVSNLALLAALVVLYRLTEREYDSPTARRAVLYLCLFPTAFILFSAYSEAVFLLAAVGAIALARNRHWWWAGLAGVAATLTRSTGIIVVIALAVEAVHQLVEDRRSADGSLSRHDLASRAVVRLTASAVPLLGTAGYLLFWQFRFHDWSYPLHAEKIFWGRQFSLPWVTLWHGLNLALLHGPQLDHAWPTFDFVLVAAGLALGVWVALRTRPVYAVYTWGSILYFLTESVTARPLASDPRYFLVAFPLVWGLARLGKHPRAHEAIIAVSSGSMAIVGWLFLTTVKVI